MNCWQKWTVPPSPCWLLATGRICYWRASVKQNKGGIYYRFKTNKAEKKYREDNSKISDNYNYLESQETNPNPEGYKKLGWVVPSEEYKRTAKDNSIIENNLKKSGFSK